MAARSLISRAGRLVRRRPRCRSAFGYAAPGLRHSSMVRRASHRRLPADMRPVAAPRAWVECSPRILGWAIVLGTALVAVRAGLAAGVRAAEPVDGRARRRAARCGGRSGRPATLRTAAILSRATLRHRDGRRACACSRRATSPSSPCAARAAPSRRGRHPTPSRCSGTRSARCPTLRPSPNFAIAKDADVVTLPETTSRPASRSRSRCASAGTRCGHITPSTAPTAGKAGRRRS